MTNLLEVLGRARSLTQYGTTYFHYVGDPIAMTSSIRHDV